MRTVTIHIVAVLLAVVGSASVQTQSETVLDAIKRGSTGSFRTSPSGRPPSIEQVLRETDVIVRGVVGQPVSYLSDDQRNVYTDYPIHAPVIVQSREPLSAMSAIAVTQLGGTVVIDKKSFTQIEDGLRALEPGTEGLFLLKQIGKRLMIAEVFFGAFRISDEKLFPLTSKQGFASDYAGRSVDEAASHFADLLRKNIQR